MKTSKTESGADDSGWLTADLRYATLLATVLRALKASLDETVAKLPDDPSNPSLSLPPAVTSTPVRPDLHKRLKDLTYPDLKRPDVKKLEEENADVAEETLALLEQVPHGLHHDDDSPQTQQTQQKPESPVLRWLEYGRCIADARAGLEALRGRATTLDILLEEYFPTFSGLLRRPSRILACSLRSIAARQEAMLNALIGQEGTEPYYWCADHAAKLDLLQAMPDEDVPSDKTGSRSDFLERLVEVCGRNRKIREGTVVRECSLDQLRGWRTCLETAAGKLLGGTCSLGSDAVPQTAEHFADYRPTFDETAAAITVDAPPLFVTYDDDRKRRRVCKGVLRMPPIQVAVKALDDWSHEPSHDSRRNDERLAHVTEWLRPTIKTAPNNTAPKLDWKQQPDCLLLARLLCELRAPTDPSADRSAAAQNMLGWYIIKELNLVASSASNVRAVVSGIASAASAQPLPMEPKAIRWPELAFISVGAFLPAGDCSPSVLTAIEDFDWRLWLIATYAEHPDKDKVFPKDRDLLRGWLRKTDHRNWEALKRELIECDRNPGTLARAARHCTTALLKLARPPQPQVRELWRPTFDGLKKDTHRLREAVLARLHELDPGRLGGLTPPRDPKGAIDVFTWRTSRAAQDDTADDWTAAWKNDDKPFGTMLSDEILGDGKYRATFSASSASSDDDLRLLNLPFVTLLRRVDDKSFFKPEGPYDRFALAILGKEARGSGYPDITKAIETLRGDLTGNDREHFDALVKAAISSQPDAYAVEWLSALRADPRFRFDCHPAIDKADDGFAIRPFTEKDRLAWEDSDACEGADIRVTYSPDRKLSRRVLSRGRPADGSAERLAGHLEQLCSQYLKTAYDSAREIRLGVDRCRTFPEQRERYVQGLMERACAILDAVVTSSQDLNADTQEIAPFTEVFQRLSQIATCYDHDISPSPWTLHAGTPSTAFRPDEVLPVFFHPTVPSGDVIVDRFTVDGTHARKGAFRRSAGPAPPGYDRLRELEATLPPAHPRCLELRGELDDYPRHVLDGKFRLAVQGIYDRAWKAILEAPATTADHAAWKAALADLIRKPFDMVMFEPSSVGDYPVGWTVGIDGKAPFGRHVARVVRPGVRTLDKKLIWPAVVEMG